MPDEDFGQIRLLPWDSEFFGWPTAKNRHAQLSPTDVDVLLRECAQAGVKCLYCEVEPQAFAAIERLQAAGARFVEFRVVMHRRLADLPAAPGPAPQDEIEITDQVRDDDVPYLGELFRRLAHWSRFAADSRFGVTASERLYAQWLRHSLAGGTDTLLVARRNERVVGFVALTCSAALATMTLLEVDPAARGQGVGARLIAAAFAWAAQRVPELELTTQGRNVTALRTFERSGMMVKRVACCFHLWFD